MELKRLAIIVPCYNEEKVFPTTVAALSKVLQELTIKKNSSEQLYSVCE